MPGNWQPFTQPQLWKFIFDGWLITVEIAVSAIGLSLVFGVLLALARTSTIRLISWPATLYIETIRALPVFLIIFYTYLAAPRLGINLPALASAILALTMYTSAVLAEIVRAGIGGLARGQLEAARSLGLSYPQAMRFVILPQAVRNMSPAIVSQLITLTKDTSLASIIGLNELARRAGIIHSNFFNPLETLFIIASIYFAMCYSLSLVARRLEARRAAPPLAGRAIILGEADQVLAGR